MIKTHFLRNFTFKSLTKLKKMKPVLKFLRHPFQNLYSCKSQRQKSQNLLSFVTFKELQEKSMFSKITAKAFETADFLNIFLKF